jgi:hypothetical protein
MQTLKILAALAALAFSSLVHGQAYFECGSAACIAGVAPWTVAVGIAPADITDVDITGINDLNVGGDLFDVTFTSTPPASSPFVLSDVTAAPGQPLTGIDAGNAIWDFWAAQYPPYSNDPGYNLAGDPGPGFITAFGPAGPFSAEYEGSTEVFDAVQTVAGNPIPGFSPLVAEVGRLPVGNQYVTADGVDFIYDPGEPGSPYYTVWTPIAAPEIDSSFAASGLALLLGGIAVAARS